MEYVIGDEESLKDLSQPGALAAALKGVLSEIQSKAAMRRRWASVRDRFGWTCSAHSYWKCSDAVQRPGTDTSMEHFYFWTLSALVGGTLIHGLAKTERFFEYPYFMATAFAVFIIPQAVSLVRFPGAVNEEWLGNTLLMACLCFGMCWFGVPINVSLAEGALVTASMRWRRLFLGSLVFIAISYYFNFLISRMTPDETGGSMWTGPVTIYGFFALLIYPAFAHLPALCP